MTLRQAFQVAAAPSAHPIHFTPDEASEWAEAEAALIAAGYCSACACHGERSQLRPWQDGNFHEHAGRECPNCEEFIICGPQPEYESPAEWRGDAAPGL